MEQESITHAHVVVEVVVVRLLTIVCGMATSRSKNSNVVALLVRLFAPLKTRDTTTCVLLLQTPRRHPPPRKTNPHCVYIACRVSVCAWCNNHGRRGMRERASTMRGNSNGNHAIIVIVGGEGGKHTHFAFPYASR